jgi:hypothetical protein
MAPSGLRLTAGPLADALKRNRESLNARFVQAQRTAAAIDVEAFMTHLVTVVDPIVGAVASHFAEKGEATAIALYDVSLELLGHGIFGPEARDRAVAAVWLELLPSLPRLLAREPRGIAASLTNAAHNIAQIAGARPSRWIEQMIAIGPQCEDPQTLLNLGKVAAWQAGCPQYRATAMQLARTAPAELLAKMFRIPPQTPATAIQQAIDAMERNAWLDMAAAVAGPDPSRLRIAHAAGGFRGFGGPFLRPPVVAVEGDQLTASDGDYVWALFADVFGWTFHRLRTGNLKPKKGSGPAALSANGDVAWTNARASFPELANCRSAACQGHTLAVTLPASHLVFLIARG